MGQKKIDAASEIFSGDLYIFMFPRLPNPCIVFQVEIYVINVAKFLPELGHLIQNVFGRNQIPLVAATNKIYKS